MLILPPVTVIRSRTQLQSGAATDHNRANFRSGWTSPLSAALAASRYLLRASPSSTRLTEPHANAGRPSFIASTSPALVLRSSVAFVPKRRRSRRHRQAGNSQHEAHVSLMARRSRDDGCRTAETDASRGHPHHYERLWRCGHERNARSPFQGGTDGPAEAKLICE